MILLLLLLNFLSIASNPVFGQVQVRRETENLADFFLEEVIVNSFLNPSTNLPDELISNVLDPMLLSDRDIRFLLFTKENANDPAILRLGDVQCLTYSYFNPDNPTKVLIHGWTDTGNTKWLHDAKRNYLFSGDYNVIIVDWSAGSLKEYLVSAKLTKQVGEYLAQILDFLRNEGVLDFDDLHLLGHSLGAHIAGIAGLNLMGKVSRITGMDPARPDFEVPLLRDVKDRLDITDAQFVDVIHTCAGTAGFVHPLGHADFYPNGGSFRQPGCPIFVTQYCSHGRSHQFIEESIINPEGFPALECNSWKDFKSGKCDKSPQRIVYMGENLNNETRGIYFLETNAESPFGKGTL